MMSKSCGNDDIIKCDDIFYFNSIEPALSYHLSYDIQNYTGNVTTYDYNGRVAMITNYDNGIRNGEFQSWFSNGSPCCIGKYSDGQKIEYWITYDFNGNKSAFGEYKSNKKVGNCQECEENVVTRTIVTRTYKYVCSADGSTLKVSHDDADYGYDNVKIICNYSNGFYDGEYCSWFSNGKVCSKGKYLNGNKIGEWIN